MSKTRRNHGSVFKAKVALEALKGEQTVAEIAAKLHPTLVTEWKRQLADGASSRKGRARPKRTARRWLASFTRVNSSLEGNTGAFFSMIGVGDLVQQGVKNLVGSSVSMALARS
jgi:hypothetical protein